MYQIRRDTDKFLIHQSYFNIKHAPYFDIDQVKMLLGSRLSATNTKKLDRLKEGCSFEFCKYGAGVNMELYRLTPEEIQKIDARIIIESELREVNAKIRALIPSELLDKRRELEYKLRTHRANSHVARGVHQALHT